MADRSAVASVDPLANTTDAWDLVRDALASGAEGAPAWPVPALERLRDAVGEIERRFTRTRALGFAIEASPGFFSLAAHLGIPTADEPATAAAAVEEGCEAA